MNKIVNGIEYKERSDYPFSVAKFGCWERIGAIMGKTNDKLPDIICECGNDKFIIKYGAGQYEVNVLCECGRLFNIHN